MKNEFLIIFVKNPIIGHVKTRLAAKIGDKLALKVYKELTKHTALITKKIKSHKNVYYSKEILKNDIWNETCFQKRIQSDGDLGERMKTAFNDGFNEGYSKVIIIGSDIYSLEKSDIEKAFYQLNFHDAVIGPATDGGYYLLGLRSNFSSIFDGKEWSSKNVLYETLIDLKSKSFYLLDYKNDIDNCDDLLKEKKLLKKLKINAENY
jgi:rSAM/selenodomain-associated transferase 1